MSFLQFSAILRARWITALLVLLLTVVTTVAVSLVLPKRYTATASIVLEIKPDPVAGMMFAGMTAPGYIATQVDILSSDRVAQRVVRTLRLIENADVRQEWLDAMSGRGSFEAWIASNLRRELTVKPSRESSVIVVEYRAKDPHAAATIANAFVQAYLDTSVDLRVNPAREYSAFFDTRAKELREAYELAQAKLSAFQKERGILTSDERQDVESARLNDLSAQLVAMQSLAADSSSRQVQANRTADQMPEVLGNQFVSGLKAEASRLEARLQELNARLGDAHPQVIETKANLAEVKRRVETETRRVGSSVAVSNTINRQREAEVRALFEAQRVKLTRMKEKRDEQAVLQRDVESAQRAYESVLGRLTQASLEGQATRTNVGVLTLAAEPSDPSSPRIMLNIVVAIVLGAMLAVGAVMWLEMSDRRVRRAEDVVQLLDLPVIGMLPRPVRAGLTRAQLIPRRVLARLPAGSRGG